jgi:predicted alpha/beta-hydrolase family hydrolase
VQCEVDVTIAKSLDERNRQFLGAVVRSANRVVRFSGDDTSIKLTVQVAGLCREDAVRAAAGEVARIFPASTDEKYSEPRPTQGP